MKIITNNEKKTFTFAKKFAKTLKGGEVIGLIGDLGTGKTIFAKGLAAGLGVKQPINSPTFVLMKVYKANRKNIKKLVHIDAYRLKKPQDILAIGFYDYLKKNDTVVIVEWADKIKKSLPNKTKCVQFYHLGEKRKIIY